jgi:CheY-like chemotaxis protein
MRTILLVGEDALLLESRAAVLRSTSADTVNASAYELAQYSSERFDLLVLCHTLRPGDRFAVVEDALRRWPGIRVLQVLKNEWERSSSLAYADETVLSADPGKLIERAEELLRKRLNQSSRPIPAEARTPPANRQSDLSAQKQL